MPKLCNPKRKTTRLLALMVLEVKFCAGVGGGVSFFCKRAFVSNYLFHYELVEGGAPSAPTARERDRHHLWNNFSFCKCLQLTTYNAWQWKAIDNIYETTCLLTNAFFVMMRYFRSDRPHFTRAYQCSDSETYLFVKLLLCAVLWGDPQA